MREHPSDWGGVLFDSFRFMPPSRGVILADNRDGAGATDSQCGRQTKTQARDGSTQRLLPLPLSRASLSGQYPAKLSEQVL